MSSYWISFVIGDSEHPDSFDRRKSIYDIVGALDPNAWTDTTSYLLFRSHLPHEQIARTIADKLIDGLDILLVGVVGSRTAYLFGMAKLSITDHLDIKPLRKL